MVNQQLIKRYDMGGKLFNGKRLDREEFFKVQSEVKHWLVKELDLESSEYEKVCTLTQLTDKGSFGDLDMIVSNQLTESCMKLLERSEISYKKNGDVLSFLWDGFQVDLILVKEELLSYSRSYFSDGDKSNLIGKLIKHLYGITFSSKGPYIKLNFNNGEYTAKVYLEEGPYLNYSAIVLKLLGLPPRYCFTQKELFDWVVSSPFFVRYIYHLEEMNSEQRSRDKQRPFYQDWLSYLETIEKPNYDMDSRKYFFVEYLNHLYPNYSLEVQKHLRFWEEKKRDKAAFSGSLISNLTHLEGKDLGDFIRYLKQNHYEEVLSVGISMNDTSLYKDLINNLYEQYNNFK